MIKNWIALEWENLDKKGKTKRNIKIAKNDIPYNQERHQSTIGKKQLLLYPVYLVHVVRPADAQKIIWGALCNSFGQLTTITKRRKYLGKRFIP